MESILDGIITGVQNTAPEEWIAVITGLLSVWYSMKENILVYPFGIVSVLIYVYLAYNYQLYADMGVNAYYFVMSVYGWYHWKDTGGERKQIPVTINDKRENLIMITMFIGSFGLLAWFLMNFTDSDVPVWDALTTAFAIVGMWLMARKKLESWIAWIITDLISIPLYFYKDLVLTSFQFLFFTIIAVGGLIAWYRSMKREEIQFSAQ
ncbi:nicotinamide riboside transporter PnuC [Balneola sp. MJW-20]|uniref:nicotinamide riboside transporter PnuC n=1 Tax=Gracilimonas aurantiaca TaxID=3234185 RepID=UPI00346776B0